MTEPQYTPVRLCAAPDCSNPCLYNERHCSMHKSRLRRLGKLDYPAPPPVQSLPDEEWRPCPDFEDLYLVSNLGRVRRYANIRTKRSGRPLAQSPNNAGYPRVNLFRDGQYYFRFVHILVARAFIGPCPPGCEVNHKDYNRTNPHVDNLEYLTPVQNVAHEFQKPGRRTPRGEGHRFTKITEAAVRDIRQSTEPYNVLAERYGINASTVCNIRARRSWKHVE